MARATLPPIYCWTLRFDPLTVHMASSERGALQVSLCLNHTQDCQDFFAGRWPSHKVLKGRNFNLPLIEHVTGALSGQPASGELPLDIHLTPFQRKALDTIARIPFGQTMTYGQVATAMGQPAASRAVGQAMGRNPLPLIYP
jgi:O6-methylguanine-DNA--protein-cysteine methyltransferase